MKKITKKRPNAVCLDVDDTLVDFVGMVCLYHNILYKDEVLRHSTNLYPLPPKLFKSFKLLEKEGIYLSLPVFLEVKQALQTIRNLGYKIVMLTARKPQFALQTKLHFEQNGLIYDEVVFSNTKAQAIKKLNKRYNIVAFVDDKPDHIIDVYSNCHLKHVFLMNRPHNLHQNIVSGVLRINDLMELIKYLRYDK